MGRFRTINPATTSDPVVATLPDSGWRLYHSLFTIADDEGRLHAAPEFLNGTLLWGAVRTADDVSADLAELEKRGLILRYSANGVAYASIVGWREKGSRSYQVINKFTASSLPEHSGRPPVLNGNGNGNGMEGKHTGVWAPSLDQLERLKATGADPEFQIARFLKLKASKVADEDRAAAFDAWILNAKPGRKAAKGRAEPAPASAHPPSGKVAL